MSLTFKPKIPENFSTPVTKTQTEILLRPNGMTKKAYEARVKKEKQDAIAALRWSQIELDKLVRLRVLNVVLSECGRLLNRTPAACGGAVETYDLYGTIKNQRQVLVEDAIK